MRRRWRSRRRRQKQRAAEEELALEGLRKADEKRKAEEDQQRKAEEQRQAEEQRRAEEQRQAEEKKRLDEERKQAELKKKADEEKKRKEAALKKKRDDEKKRRRLRQSRSSSMPRRSPPCSTRFRKRCADAIVRNQPSPAKAKGPALGAPEGKDKQISASEIAMLKGRISARLRGSWRLPSGGGGSDTPVVTLRWRLKPDGSLDGDPHVEQPRGDRLVPASQLRRLCAPCGTALPIDLPLGKIQHLEDDHVRNSIPARSM